MKTYFYTPILAIWLNCKWEITRRGTIHSKNYLLEMPCSHAKVCLKSAQQKLDFVIVKFISESYKLHCSSKIQNVIFYFGKRAAKKRKHFFKKAHHFVMGGPINMNAGVFWEASVGFLKSVVLQLFPKCNQSYVNFNVKSRPKFNGH